MIPIPKELQGKPVEKFEDWLEWLIVIGNFLREIVIYLRFLRQPFNPAMIEEYFEGMNNNMAKYTNIWEYDCNDGFFIRMDKGMGELVIYIGGVGYCPEDDIYSYTRYTRLYPQPQTLSDFIDACLNSDIKLTWRKK